MKSASFRDFTHRRNLVCPRRFGTACRLHLSRV